MFMNFSVIYTNVFFGMLQHVQPTQFCPAMPNKQTDGQDAAGVLFRLDPNTFRSVVTSTRGDSKALIKTLRSISLLQPLSVGQLEQLAQIMVPVSQFPNCTEALITETLRQPYALHCTTPCCTKYKQSCEEQRHCIE